MEPNPELLRWLHGPARDLNLNAYFSGFCEQLVQAELPVRRAHLALRELHPEYLARTFVWRRTGLEMRHFYRAHSPTESEAFNHSPVKRIFEGAAPIRCRIETNGGQPAFPILNELAEEGITDYANYPVQFRRDERHSFSVATDRDGGFGDPELRTLEAILPAFATQLEVLALDQMVHTLLDTYVGPSAGKRVLEGTIARGEGKRISAVLWFADLRRFTELSEFLDNDALISLLNDYFECIVAPVEEGGGEVLKFIGDAVLAVFPLPQRATAADVVCEVALAAAEQAIENVMALRSHPASYGECPVRFGVALHVGEVTFGNVGSEHRLDFTVIGRDVNLAARLQDLSSRLGTSLILSEAFVRRSKRDFVDLGEHPLKGIAENQRAYTLRPSVDTVVGSNPQS